MKDLKTHTQDQEFTKGYLKGIQGYWWNRGLVEGYSGLPPSLQNKNYTDAYKSEHTDYVTGRQCTKDLGTLPVHTNDNYRQFYLGMDQGGDAYNLVGGLHRFLEDGPPGHSEEYYAGWKFGYGFGLVFDSDCP